MILNVPHNSSVMINIVDPDRMTPLTPDRAGELSSHPVRRELLRLSNDWERVNATNADQSMDVLRTHADDAWRYLHRQPLCRERIRKR
jgi:hypothetical protein